MRINDNPHLKKIVGIINDISSSYGPETIYREWCECLALSIANSCDLLHGSVWRKREDRYLSIISKYNNPTDRKIVDAFPEMSAELTLSFELDPFHDYLGNGVYMQLFGGQKKLGQCFTPDDVCYVCAQTAIEPPNENTPFPITINDPAVGGGAMLIAACRYYNDLGVDYQRKVKFWANDVDSLCVHMSYIQLSLLGCRAIVERKDTITQELFDRFVTPMEILWPATLFVDDKPKDTAPKDTPVYTLTAENKSEQSAEVVSIDSLMEV